ncbi:MAG: hypothetical protein EPO21_23425 [Chloroflexota bacterium]|nr:MAG: hypothetical protein EPO21_23425 [Chloroflexota bacterium]
MELQHFAYRQEGRIGVLTINRPEKLNAFGRTTMNELSQAIDALALDDSICVTILTGVGDRAFSAGADLSDMGDTPADPTAFTRLGQTVLAKMENMGKPIIAAVNGFALGGGCEIALACTLRVAAESAQFGLPELGLGILPGWGGTQRLPRLIGKGRALEMMLTGRRVPAQEALAIGLVNRVVPAADLLQAATELANTISEKAAPLSVKAAIRAVNYGMELPLEHATLLESQLCAVVGSSEDAAEGRVAFMEKRKPQFKGR